MKWWWIKLARYALPQWRGLTVIGTLMLATVFIKLLAPWPLKLIVDHVLPKEPLPEAMSWISTLPGAGSPQGHLAWLAAATVGLFLLQRFTKITQSYVVAGTSSRMTYGLATDLFNHLQRRSLLFHGGQRVGDLVKRVTSDTACTRDLVMGVYLPIVTSLITLVSMFLIMWQLSRVLAVFAVVMALPLGFVTKWFAKPMSNTKYREKELQGELAALAEQTLSAIPIVQAYGREKLEEMRFGRLATKTIRANLRANLCREKFRFTAGTISSGATAGVMLIGGIYVLQGSASVGTLIVFMAYFSQLYSPMETLAYLGSGFASAGAGARRVLEVLQDDDIDVRERIDARSLPAFTKEKRGHIRLECVTFGYADGRPALHDVSLEARPGEIVALVGHTGAGKSTLVSLIARLYDPWQGCILYDGVDIRDVRLKSLRAGISMVLQEPFLLPLSVDENIAYGRPEASRDEIVKAAQAARADEFIRNLPSGYDTVIGERGATLSGGERQRLSIARALLKDSPVLILDEPTSALDARTEGLLIDALQELMQGRTALIIAHRLSTIQMADRIVVLDHGRVIERGTQEELLADAGHYDRLHRLQFGNAKHRRSSLSKINGEGVST